MRDEKHRTGRSGGRSTRRATREAHDFSMLPGLTRSLPLCEVMDEEHVHRIDDASMSILENVGIVFRDEIALADWRQAGADVSGELVRLDRGLVRELIKSIPSDFTYHARNPDRNVRLGGKHCMFIPMTGAPFLRDLDDVRRNPTLDDLAMFHKLAHMMPALHSSAHHIVEPYDHAISQRHLRITYSSMKYSDKTFMGMTTTPKNAEDVIEMCRVLFGADFLEDHCVVTGNCNGNSPLVWDEVPGNIAFHWSQGELDAISPKVVVLLIGTNNCGPYSAEEISAGIQKIISLIHEKIPATKVLALGTFPRGPRINADGNPDNWESHMEKIRAVNADLAALDNGDTIRHLDLTKNFTNEDGTIPKIIMPDQVPLTPAGYQLWADAMHPLLTEMLT